MLSMLAPTLDIFPTYIWEATSLYFPLVYITEGPGRWGLFTGCFNVSAPP